MKWKVKSINLPNKKMLNMVKLSLNAQTFQCWDFASLV